LTAGAGPQVEHGVPTTDPLPLIRALEASDRFRRDTGLGAIYHPGKISFREMAPKNSLHILIDGGHVSAHVDEVCPVICRPGGVARYSLPRVVAHNLALVGADIGRRLRGRGGQQRCNLDCEMVWVDDDQVEGLVAELEAEAPPDAADPEGAGLEGVPFSLVDEAVHLLDTEAAPWSIQLEVRVSGHLDEARLRAALDHALRSHPMARARKAPSRRSLHRDQWEIPAGTDVDPLRVVDCPDDDAVSTARAELQSRAVPLAESPPLRARLARHQAGDFLMLNVNHAAMDGFGALRVLRSVGLAYAGAEDQPPPLGLTEARDLPRRLVAANLAIRLRRALALVEKLRDLVVHPARIAADGAGDQAGYGFHHVSLTADRTAALVAMAHPGTVNDVLLTALHLAVAGWNQEHGQRCGRIGVLVPANLRPPEWRQDMVGNFTLPARLSTGRRHRRSPRAALDRITTQTRRKKRSGMGTALVEVLGRSELLPMWAKQVLVMLLPLTGNRLVDTAMLANLGRLDTAPTFGPDAGETVEVWFSPPARMPLGVCLGAVTAGGRLHLALRYRHRLFDADAARRFSERYLRELERCTEVAGAGRWRSGGR